MMKITGLSHLFKWENLHNWLLTKYFFAPLYFHAVNHLTALNKMFNIRVGITFVLFIILEMVDHIVLWDTVPIPVSSLIHTGKYIGQMGVPCMQTVRILCMLQNINKRV